MILILTNDGDLSSDMVIDWLRYYHADYLRVNTSNLLDAGFMLDMSPDGKTGLKICGRNCEALSIGAVWYRKFGFFRRTEQAKNIEKLTDSYTVGHMSTEFTKVMNTLTDIFGDRYWLTDPRNIFLTKPAVLRKAASLGFAVPHTYIVNSKKDLLSLLCGRQLISKSVYDPMSISAEGERYLMFTKPVDIESVNELPETFLPSLVQEAVPKKFEIRTFYLEGECYSMAIFSQDDDQTAMDYRKYNMNRPNRFVPYDIGWDMECMVDGLMKELGLNTGSLDFIMTGDGTPVFLEVNPTGQFGMVDFSCNYGLHRKVARLLIDRDGQNIESRQIPGKRRFLFA